MAVCRRGVRDRERVLRLSVHDAAPGRRLAIVEVEADATSSDIGLTIDESI